LYSLQTPLPAVTGIGPTLAAKLATIGLESVKDFLLWVPLRYEDRSQKVTISQLQAGELITMEATVDSKSNYYRGRRSIQSATVSDETGKLKLMWFNNKYIIDKLVKGQSYLISGKLNDRGMMVQPIVENVGVDSLHTNRLVPLYSQMPAIKQGTLRRILKHILDSMETESDLSDEVLTAAGLPNLKTTLYQLHFPDQPELVVKARERLAVEELLGLMKKSLEIKSQWENQTQAPVIGTKTHTVTLPFELTAAQQKSLSEVLQDLRSAVPMNRLLVGDVGSGKTVVAGLAALQMIKALKSVALVAPTRILVEQHAQTLQKLFPELPIKVISMGTTKAVQKELASNQEATFYIGTHALINQLGLIKPGLLIYDEQHRFGVNQRSATSTSIDGKVSSPHILTMSATPIPRSLMLTIFSHLQLSVIDQMPQGRVPVKTWVVPERKRPESLEWIEKHLSEVVENSSAQPPASAQALIVCPFIDPSRSEALVNVAAVTETFEVIKTAFPQRRVALLHGRMTKTDQKLVTDQLYEKQLDILVTTPIVEVGVDLPAANIIVIEAADRFGLASLHQLRGRVGRAGQQAYCLVFSASQKASAFERLQRFSQISNGQELADLDLENRGAGDIFGTQQSGFDQLRFASWTNVELIKIARTVFEQLNQLPEWQPLLDVRQLSAETVPLAN